MAFTVAALAALIASANALVTPQVTCDVAKWSAIRDDLISDVFEGICGEAAHSVVRIAFHDAIGFSKTQNFGGGADGSMIQFQDVELTFAANAGIDDIVGDIQPFADAHGISYGDVIQFGSSVALSLCPGAPIVQTFVGRPNATRAAPDGTVPDPFNPITQILARMGDAGFSAAETVALLASHSIAAQDEIEPTINGSPFDSTPGVFDSQIFIEVLFRGIEFPGDGQAHQGQVESGLNGEFRLQSDHNFARDSATSCTWQSFALNQALMSKSFGQVMGKLGLLGFSSSQLQDCTSVIPAAPPSPVKAGFFPAGKTHSDIEQACATQLFPTTLSTQAGTPTPIARVAPQ